VRIDRPRRGVLSDPPRGCSSRSGTRCGQLMEGGAILWWRRSGERGRSRVDSAIDEGLCGAAELRGVVIADRGERGALSEERVGANEPRTGDVSALVLRDDAPCSRQHAETAPGPRAPLSSRTSSTPDTRWAPSPTCPRRNQRSRPQSLAPATWRRPRTHTERSEVRASRAVAPPGSQGRERPSPPAAIPES
jgi:hypothetical protein